MNQNVSKATYRPSFSKVAAFGRVRLFTKSSNLNEDGFVALETK
jgi:hypothetical protein